MHIAFLGIGLMGAPMARRLLRAGHQMTLWNRTRAKADALAPEGAAVVDAPADAVAAADIVISILENGSVVEDILFRQGVARAARTQTIFVDMSSIAPHLARDHAARLAALGLGHIDAPVSGGPDGAAEGTLAIMAGGSEENFARVSNVLNQMGRPTLVGPSGAGQFAKLTSQMIASTAMAAVAEALLLARAEGIEPRRIRAALTGGFADSKILQIHGDRMDTRNFVPGGHVHTFVKDLSAARDIVQQRGLDLPVTGLAFDLFRTLAGRGYGACDISGLALEIETRNPPHRIGQNCDKLPQNQS